MTSESKKEQPPPLFQSFPLHECCREGQYDKMIEILNNSKDVKKLIEKKDEDERTPLHWTAASGHSEIVGVLLEKNPNFDLSIADDSGWTPFLSATSAGHIGVLKKILEFLENDDQRKQIINQSNTQKNIPLHYAASKGHDEIVQLLIDNGSKLNAANKFEQTPIMKAVCTNQLKVVQQLVDAGADVARSDKDGNNVLHLAALNLHRPMVVYLLKHREKFNLDVNEENYEKKTLADIVYGQDNLDKLINVADKQE